MSPGNATKSVGGVPSLRTDIRILIAKAKARYAARKHKKTGITTAQRTASLLFAAQCLCEDIQGATTEAEALIESAKATLRPGTPPLRDPLFQRPEDAPLSDYEKQVDNHNEIIRRYQHARVGLGVLQERVPTFQEQVKALRAEHVPAKKMGKAEHDIESLENASRNLELAMLKLAGKVGKGKRVAR